MCGVSRCLLLSLLLGLCSSPVLAEDQLFDSNGVRIRYIDQGRGEPVVLLHGYTNVIEKNWVETGVLQNLVEDFRVIALDMRGHCKSDKPHAPNAYGEEMAKDVVRLLDHVGIKRAHIVGYSFGGRVTAKLLTTNPDRFITATLVGSSGQRGWTDATARSMEAQAIELESSSTPYRTMVQVTTGLDEPVPTEDAIRRGSREIAARNDPVAHAAMLRGIQGLAVTNAQLSAVKVPTLAIVGTADRAFPGVQELKAAWPQLQVVIVDRVTHWGDRGIVVRPELPAALRTFITANRSPSGAKEP
jgi:pimeloyl-ACP methyl ester carboxylesterase